MREDDARGRESGIEGMGGRGSLDIGGSIATYYSAAIAASNLSLNEWLCRGPLLIMVSPLIQIEIGLPLSWNAPRGSLISSAGQERTGRDARIDEKGKRRANCKYSCRSRCETSL
ncbi:unnamed protein product [Lasius platythorax]|uniref:Uncharacterized protein n=1 Tax=Lasius platythorax TaxID=488582 RepID=A0AAV2P479_9HYME